MVSPDQFQALMEVLKGISTALSIIAGALIAHAFLQGLKK